MFINPSLNNFEIFSRYLQEQLHFIDKRRLAVWGWSYGGFIATMLLSYSEQKLFNCGVAISPVVSWKLYGKKKRKA